MGSRGKLCFCATISSNAFWGSLLSVIDGWLKLVGTHIFSFLVIFGLWQILPVVFCRNIFSTRDLEIYEFLVTRTSRERKFPEKEKSSARDVVFWYECFSHPSITDSKEPQNALLLTVKQKQSFPRKPILLYSTGLLNNSKKEPPPSTGLLGRPLKASWNPRVSTPSTKKQRILTLAHSNGWKTKWTVVFEITVQTKTKEGHRVETPPPRSCCCSMHTHIHTPFLLLSLSLSCTHT